MRIAILRSPFVCLLAVLFAGAAGAQLTSEYADWGDGPAGFLLTKKEKKEWKKISSDAAAEEFIELFWARRNPDLNTAFNSFRAEFEARVVYADEHFGSRAQRGALSDRGMVLIVLGAPRYRQAHTPETAVTTFDTQSQATDQARGELERWIYDVATLPEAFELKGNDLIFSFYEDPPESNRYTLDRSDRQSVLAMKALSQAVEAYLVHPDLTEVPTPVSIAGARSASAAHLAWLEQAEAPLDDEIRVMSGLGVLNDVNRPLWVHIELPADAPVLDTLAGRVAAAGGGALSNFEVDATPLEGQYGTAYHLAFPLDPGAYTVEIAGGSGGELQLTEVIEAEITDIPSDGTWLSPIWTGISATADENAPLGAAFTIGGWHMIPLSGPDLNREQSVSYFGFVVRPELDENGEVELRARIRLKKDGRPMGAPASMALAASPIIGDLYMYGNSVPLGRLPEPGSYSLEFEVKERGSDAEVERKVPMEIHGENPFTYDDVKLLTSDDGAVQVTGVVTNNTDESFAATTFYMTLFDPMGNQIASRQVEIGNLESDGSAEFIIDFEEPPGEIKNYEIKHESEIE